MEKWDKADKLKFKSDRSDYEEPESMVFARNMTWQGIIERIEVATTQQVERQNIGRSSDRILWANHRCLIGAR